MRNYHKVVDLVRRRIGDHLRGDSVQTVYVDMMEEGALQCTIIVPDFLNARQVTALAVKYNRCFDDLVKDVDITVQTEAQYFKPKDTEYPIYDEERGFNV